LEPLELRILSSVRNSAAEDDEIEERVGTKTVGTVDGDRRGFATSKQTRNDLIVALSVLSDDFTCVLGRNTTHVVMDGRQDGDGLLGNVDTCENGGSLRNTRETLVENLRWQMAELEVNVVFVRANTTAFANLEGH
jgi:hypothetical protein